MKPIDYWRLCEKLSVRQAALLIMGEDPGDYENHNIVEKPYEAITQALLSALEEKTVVGQICTGEYGGNDYYSEVQVESLKEWLERKGIRSGFFYPNAQDTPNYLDPGNPYYSPKLAAAVFSWLAVTGEKRFTNNGKSPKSNIENWLTANAEKFGLVGPDGEINNTAIKEQISKVVNWSSKGGSPSTPIHEPTPIVKELAPLDFDDDSDIPF